MLLIFFMGKFWLIYIWFFGRYSFAISAQTARGPTSVRVIYFMGKFRLDSIPGKEFEMPLFDCPFKMLEYYCDYERHVDENRAYWVDCQCKLFAHIHMTQPLVKKVPSLSHLARLAVNKNDKRLEEQTKKLPPVIKNYLDEYPYTVWDVCMIERACVMFVLLYLRWKDLLYELHS